MTTRAGMGRMYVTAIVQPSERESTQDDKIETAVLDWRVRLKASCPSTRERRGVLDSVSVGVSLRVSLCVQFDTHTHGHTDCVCAHLSAFLPCVRSRPASVCTASVCLDSCVCVSV